MKRVALLIFCFMVGFVFCFFKIIVVRSESMSDTLRDGSITIALRVNGLNRNAVAINRGDIVIVSRGRDANIIKRVVGVEGDNIEILDYGQSVLLNGQPLSEPYIRRVLFKPGEKDPFQKPARKVQPSHVFLLGDNRRESTDSRDFGDIDMQSIVGKVICCAR